MTLSPSLARIPVPFRWNVNDGLNGSSLIARAYSSEVAGVLTRTSTKRASDRNGVLVPLVQGIPPIGWVNGAPALLLEGARTNLVLRSQAVDTWSDVNSCSVSVDALLAPDLSLTADLLTSSVTASERATVVALTGDGTKVASVYLRAGTSAFTRVRLRDITALVDRHVVNVTWTDGVPTIATQAGAGTLYPVEPLVGGWYRISFSADSMVAANNNRVSVLPDVTSGTGTVGVWGAQVEDAVVPSSYIPTDGSALSRAADALYFPFTLRPAAMTLYLRGRERGTRYLVSGRYAEISSAAGASPRFLAQSTTSAIRTFHGNGSSDVSNDAALLAAVGDVLEARSTLASTGVVKTGVSVNAGAETVSGGSGTNALASAWAGQRIYLNQSGAGTFVGQFAYTHVCVALGEQPLDIMRELAGV